MGQASGAASGKLYQVELGTGASSSQDLNWSGFIGGVTTDGQIVGAESVSGVWYGALIDPQTALVTKKMPFGDLSAVSYVVYDSTLNVAHTVGSNLQGKVFLYSLDFSSGKLRHADEPALRSSQAIAAQRSLAEPAASRSQLVYCATLARLARLGRARLARLVNARCAGLDDAVPCAAACGADACSAAA